MPRPAAKLVRQDDRQLDAAIAHLESVHRVCKEWHEVRPGRDPHPEAKVIPFPVGDPAK